MNTGPEQNPPVDKNPAKKDIKPAVTSGTVLVILHGGMREFILATGAFEAIRKQHLNQYLILLTTSPFVHLAQQSGFFDEIWVDPLPDWIEFGHISDFIKKMKSMNFRMVYDLQDSFRSHTYFRLMGRKKPNWSSTIRWCSHPYKFGRGESIHPLKKMRKQLFTAGIDDVPDPDVSWVQSDVSAFGIEEPYALIAPGGNERKKGKRWYEEGFVEVAEWFSQKVGLLPVFIGGPMEDGLVKSLVRDCVGTKTGNLCSKTSIEDIIQLAVGAEIAVGNETGPMHLISVTGCPSLFLFSEFSNPEIFMPYGENVNIIAKDDLNLLESGEVINMLDEMLLDTHDISDNSAQPAGDNESAGLEKTE